MFPIESRIEAIAKIDELFLKEFGESCSAVLFLDDTDSVVFFEVYGKRFRKDEGDRVRLYKGDCTRCGIPLWNREFILRIGSVQLAIEGDDRPP